MVDFEMSGMMKQVKGMLHGVAESMLRPASLEADRTGEIPHDLLVRFAQLQMMRGSMAKSEREAAETEAGAGKKPKSTARISAVGAEELSWGDPAIMLTMPGPGLGGPPVQIMGTPEQKERYLSIFSNPEDPKWGAYALTEPGAGSDVAGIRTSAVKDGEHYILNGRKCYITNGARAEWNVVFATVDPSLGRAGHRAFVVEKSTPGFSVGRIEKKMGLRASETAELVFENCRVHKDCLLGGEEHYASKEGFMGAMKTFNNTRPIVAAGAIGIARSAFEEARDHLKSRYMLSRPIPRYQKMQDTLAGMHRKLQMGRALVWRACWMSDHGIPNAKEASMSKAYAAKAAVEVCIDAVGLMGADGLQHSGRVEKCFRDIKVFDIFEGTGQIQRIVIAKRMIAGLKGW